MMKYFLPICLFTLMPLIAQAQAPSIKWQYNLRDAAFGQAAAADIDNDGKLEIVFSTYRNDGFMYVLNAENGSLKWKYDVGGCADAAPLIYDVDGNGDLEIVLAGSCNPVTFCFDADSGFVQWQTPIYGSDSPPSIADLDKDGKLEIIHGQFDGYVISINGENGSVNWNFQVDTGCWVQTDPAIVDVDKNGQLDFVVGTWSFNDTASALYCYTGNNHTLKWKNRMPQGTIYHGAAFGDLDKDGKAELTIGDYNGDLYCLNAENGTISWRDSFPPGFNYIGAPTSMADLDRDGWLDVVICDAYHVRARKHNGQMLWDYAIPKNGTAFRGVAIADINNDSYLDVTFGTSAGEVISLNGNNGTLIKSFDLKAHYGKEFNLDHAPLIADFDNDGVKDVFIVGGHAEYPAIQNNYGHAYALSWGVGKGPDWKMFRRDVRRSACVCDSNMNPLTPVGVEKMTTGAKNLLLYPNPAHTTISFEAPVIVNPIVLLYNGIGQRIEVPVNLQNGIVVIDIRQLARGVYHLFYKNEESEYSARFTKE